MSGVSENKNKRIGIFDSGLGGLTVLNHAMRLMENEYFMYYADTKNVPYGDKTPEQIHDYVDRAVRYMIDNGCKAVVIACNTATSAGIDFLRVKYSFVPIIGIEPAVKPAIVSTKKPKRVLVTATPVTVEGSKLKELIKTYDKDHITDVKALPKLAMLAERGEFSPDVIVPYLKGELAGFDTDIYGAVVLGCTHFPFFYDSFKAVFPNAQITDGSGGAASHLKTRLLQEQLLRDDFEKPRDRVVYIQSLSDGNDRTFADRAEVLNERWQRLFGYDF